MAGKRFKGTGGCVPANPYKGQLYYDAPTSTMRVWNGKLWEEKTQEEVRNVIKDSTKRPAD